MTRRSIFHLCVLFAYIALGIAAYFLGWLKILTFTAVLSVWALVEGRWGVFQASRAQDEAGEAKHVCDDCGGDA